MDVIERPLKKYVANLSRSIGQTTQSCCKLRAFTFTVQQRSESCVKLCKTARVFGGRGEDKGRKRHIFNFMF